jgi:type II secretory pathway pseudopilin PulG
MKMRCAIYIHRREAGFTMAEIAIALGVIAIALIAIIGILPSGLQVQRDNREETIINQDARLLLQAVRTGGRDDMSDIGSFVRRVDGTNFDYGIPTADLVRFLSDPYVPHAVIFSAVSGGVASRGSDVGFRYRVVNSVMDSVNTNVFGGANFTEFTGTRLSNQVHEVRLRFSWPVKPDGSIGPEANRFVARTVVSGWHTNGVVYAQEFYQPTHPTP